MFNFLQISVKGDKIWKQKKKQEQETKQEKN